MMTILLVFLISCSVAELDKAQLIEGKTRSQYEARSNKYVISSQGEATTMAAKFAFDSGGNIYDAFVAASFAISVERPHSTGLGGGGFLLSYDAQKKKTYTYDFREVAPLKANKEMFLDKNQKQIRDKSRTGAFAVATPGLVAGLVEIHKKHGKLSLAKLMEPAVSLAQDGFKIYPALAVAIKASAPKLCRYRASKKIFLNENCIPKKEGEILKQKDLAKTLKAIARKGRDGFYKGYVADQIVKYQKETKGYIRHKDLNEYRVKQRDAVTGMFRGKKIVSMPPPSSGGVHIIEILNILSGYDLKSMGAGSAKAIHLTSSAMQIAFADRAKYMGDSDFAKVPVKELIDPAYAAKLREKINLNKANDSKKFPQSFRQLKYESDDTTHFTIMDSKGNVVTSTQTINGWFGSAMVTPKTGIVMNNEMDDFASHVGGVNLFGAIGGKNNLVEPLKRPLSSMSPTIVFDEDDNPILALGTPSGTRILTCVMQTILNVLEHDMELWDAVASTRYHHQWSPDEIRVGPPYFSSSVESELKNMGYKINKNSLGCKVQAISKNGSSLLGVSDPREEGMSYGKR